MRVVVDKLTQPSGVAFNKGSLYVFAIDKVLRYDGIATNPDVQPVDMTKAFDLPPEQHHNWKYIAFGPDGKLYVPFGAPCNICEPPTKEYAQIRRYNADGSGKEILATGVRNTQGFDWHPKTGELWFTDHGRDWLGDNTPRTSSTASPSPARNFGFPYCHANGINDPDVKKDDACKGVTMPVPLMGPHAAVMGVKFYTGKMFPAEYQNTMFVVRKGSWNRSKPNGFDVVNVRAGADGKGAKMTPVPDRLQRGEGRLQVLGPPGVRRTRCPTARCWCPTSRPARSTASATARRRPRRNSAVCSAQRAVGFLLTAFFSSLCFAQRIEMCGDLPRAGRQFHHPGHPLAGRAAEAVRGESAGAVPRGDPQVAGDESADAGCP